MYERLKDRYIKHYVTDVQLARYVSLGVVTEEQAEEIKALRIDEDKRIAEQIAEEKAEREAAAKERADAARPRVQQRAKEAAEKIESEAVDDA